MFSPSRQSALALAAAPITAILCTAATWLHYLWSGSLVLNLFPFDRPTFVTSCISVVGVLALGACCMVAYRHVSSADLRKVLRWALVTHLCLLPALPLHSTDVYSYLAFGELASRGMDPQIFASVDLGQSPLAGLHNWPNTPSVYGPLANLSMALVGNVGSAFGSPLWAAGITYKLLVGILDVASLLLIYDVAVRANTEESARGFVLFALNPLAWQIAAEGHNDGLIVFFGSLYVWSLRRDREILGVIALVLGTLSKFVLLPVLGFHVWAALKRNFPRGLAVGTLALALLVLAYFVTWSGWDVEVHTWSRMFSGVAPYGLSLAAFIVKTITRVGASPEVQTWVFGICVWTSRALIIGVMLLALWRMRSIDNVFEASFLLYLAILSTAALHAPWYMVWILPFAAVQVHEHWRALALVITAMAAPVCQIPGMWLVLAALQLVGLIALVRWRPWSVLTVAQGSTGAPSPA